MHLRIARICTLGLTWFYLAIPGRASIHPGDDPETIRRAKAAAEGIVLPPPAPAPGTPAETAAETPAPAATPVAAPAATPAVAPENEPVADGSAPAETTASTDSTDATAAAPEYANPYDVIVDRNIFRLNPQPPPPPPPAPPPPDIPMIKISGFSDINGKVKGFFASVPKDPKESPKYFGLYEGERDGILELVKIHPNHEEADVIIDGTPKMTLSIKSNSFVQQVAAPVKGAPGAPPTPMPVRTMPGTMPAAVAPTPAGAGTAFIAGSGGNADYSNRGRGGSALIGGAAPFTPAASPGMDINTGGRSIPLSIPPRNPRMQPSYPPENHQGSVEQQTLDMMKNGYAAPVNGRGETVVQPANNRGGGPPPLPINVGQ